MTTTKEYTELLSYLDDVLVNEFPSQELLPEHLILSILDNPRCHANMIIDNVLMSESVEYIRQHLQSNLKSNKKPIVTEKGNKYSNELNDIISCAVNEAFDRNAPFLGSEYILLAVLNPQYNFKVAKELIKSGLKYDYVLEKVSEFKDWINNDKKENNNYINNNSNNRIPLKSEIQSKISVTNGETPYIRKYTIDLHEQIKNNKHDRLVGMTDILEKIIKVLSRRRKNNVILVGKEGVGKTSIAYCLADMIENESVPDILNGKKVIMLDTMALVSGTHLRGMFEERVDGLFKELKSNPNYILFIDDMQNVLRNGSKDKDCDLTDIIGNILSEGDVRVIGAISLKYYRNCIENNGVLSNKLQKIIIEPSTKEDTYKILSENKSYYENFHHVKYGDNVLRKAVSMAQRYITTNNLPDSAIDVIDLAGASVSLSNKQEKSIKEIRNELSLLDDEKKAAMNCGDFEKLDKIAKDESVLYKKLNDVKNKINNDKKTWIKITENDIAETVSTMTNIPVAKLKSDEREVILHIADILKNDVIGQDEAIDEISKAIKRAKAGFGDKSKVMATILFLGNSGVGKTLISKKLAENIFGSENCLIRFDMSEYQDKTSVNKLIGASAGYVGYENGGLLTEAIKNKPYCVLLFDEIEKADESIYNLFLQLFDEGRLTDNNGITVNFKNVIVIMTSNVGARKANELGGGIGFITNKENNQRSIIEKSLKSKFNPEFLNRIDKIVHFNQLTDENIHQITVMELNKLRNRVKENDIILNYDDNVVEYVYKEAIKQKEYGARPIMRIIQDNISDKVVDLVLESGKNQNTYRVSVNDNNEIVAEVEKKR